MYLTTHIYWGILHFPTGCYFGFYDSLKPILLGDDAGVLVSFCLGYAVTVTSGLISYPIDTIRRRMMMTSGQAVKYKVSFYLVSLTWLCLGFWPNLECFSVGARELIESTRELKAILLSISEFLMLAKQRVTRTKMNKVDFIDLITSISDMLPPGQPGQKAFLGHFLLEWL